MSGSVYSLSCDEVFYEDLGSDTDQDESTYDLCTRSDLGAPSLSELYPYPWEHEGDDADHESREVYARDTRCERYADSERVYTRRDTEEDEGAEGEYVSLLARCCISAPSLMDHIGSDITEEYERYPVVIVHDLLRKKWRHSESDDRHDRLKKSEWECHLECISTSDMSLWYPRANRDSEGICGEWDREEKECEKSHKI